MSAHSKSGEAGVPPRVSVILDDMRWEEKLKIARERRAAVLAQKAADKEKTAPAAPPPEAWKAAVVAPLAMGATAPPVARPTVTPILPPLAAPPLPDEDGDAAAEKGNRKVVAALAASVAVAAVLAGSALTNGDPSFEGGFVSLFRTADGASAPDIEVTALGLSTVPVEVDEPNLSDMGMEPVSPTVDRARDYGAVVAPNGPTVLPQPAAGSAREPVLVAAVSPRALEPLDVVADIDRPASLVDPARIASGQAPALPSAAAGTLPVAFVANPMPDVQETVIAFAAETNDTATVPMLSDVRAVDVVSAPQVLESQGEAETGWSPAAGLGVALPIRLSVFAPSALDAEPVAALVASVEAGARTDSVVSPVDFTVSKTHVRYYRDEDLVAAKQVAALAGGSVRDFTDYAPQPAKGTVELWLAGSPDPQAQGGETVLASLQPPRGQVPRTVPTATAVPTVTTPVTPVPKVTRRKGILNSIFGRNGFYKNPRPAPAAAPAPAPTPAPTIGRFKNSVLSTLNGSGISNASPLAPATPAPTSNSVASPAQTASAAPAPAPSSGGNKLRAGKVKQAKAKAAAAAAAAKSKAKSKPKAGPGRWK